MSNRLIQFFMRAFKVKPNALELKNRTSNDEIVLNFNLLGEGNKIVGNIISKNNIRINGILEGNIEANGKVIIGKSAVVKGNINCESIVVSGKVIGAIESNSLIHLTETANIDGDILGVELKIDTGAVYRGKCSMRSDNVNKTTNKIIP